MDDCKNRINFQKIHYEKIDSQFDLIISNPPYLSFDEYQKSQYEIKNFEPKEAFIGGKDGLDFYRGFTKKIDKILNNNSYFICEIGINQLESCKNIFKKTNLILEKITKDLQNIDRILTFFKI